MEKDLMKDAGEASALLWKKTVDAVKKIPAKYKAFFGAGLITLFSQAANAAPKAPESSRYFVGATGFGSFFFQLQP